MPVTIKKRVTKKENTVERKTIGAKRMGKQQAEVKSRISLWDVDSENEKAPVARGTIQLTSEVVQELMELVEDGADIVELSVSIWNSNSENERAPTFTGLIKSPSEREAEIAASKAKGSSKTTRTRRNSK